MGIVPVLNKPALDLGTIWHAAHADWGADPTADLPTLLMTHATALLEQTLDRYKNVVGAPISQIELDPLLELIELGKSMAENYQEVWKTPFPPRYTLIAAEQTVTVPIPGTEHQLEAQFDGVVQDERGNNFVLERKTYGTNPRVEALQMNDQFLAYLWVMQQLDMPAIGIAYDGAWKRAVPPRGKSLKDLFLRTILIRPIDELAEFEEHLRGEVEDMDRPDLHIYKNETYDCSYMCGYRELCAAQSRGEDYESIIKHRFVKRERTTAFRSETETESNA